MAYCNPAERSDGLYCSELQPWGDEPEQQRGSRFPLITEPDLYWDEEELVALLSRQSSGLDSPEIGTPLALIRREAVDWILKIQAHYDFTALTAVLSVNYLDRFLVRKSPLMLDKSWLAQLTAVACLTLAVKLEEATDVPPLLVFQLGASYVFEERTIKMMELLVLSTLEWKMNPVTPLSFVDYAIRRLGLKGRSCSKLLRRCENLLLSLLPDLKLQKFLPSVVAAAAMLHVIDGLDPHLAVECQSQLLRLMPIDKEKLESCRKFMSESSGCRSGKLYGESAEPGSPRGVMEGVQLLQLQ